VSLSRRCTMPGRLTPPMPERLAPQWAISALTSVPERGRARDARRARGLVDDDEVGVLVARRRAAWPGPAARPAPARARRRVGLAGLGPVPEPCDRSHRRARPARRGSAPAAASG
jgi:hypothetical protein